MCKSKYPWWEWVVMIVQLAFLLHLAGWYLTLFALGVWEITTMLLAP